MQNARPREAVLRALPGHAAARRPAGPETELITLVHAARAGDDAAWRRLLERLDRGLRAIARSYRLPPADVDDVVQEAWLRLLTSLDRLRDPAAVAGWLATTTRRESLSRLQVPVREILTDDARLGESPDGDGPEGALLAADNRVVLARGLATLPDRHRRLMTLLATEPGLSYRQIAATLDIPVGSIGPIRARCLARLARNEELQALYAD